MSGKGSSRRPTDPRHALTCDTGHVWLGGRCFRCNTPQPEEPREPTN